MSKKKGLSVDEKKVKVLEIFHESRDVFQLKDIEKIAPKRGVIQQSVKDVVQALVDDNDLHQEKIGSSNFFWAFPGERAAKVRSDLERSQKLADDLAKQHTALLTKLQSSKVGKENSEGRAEKLKQVADLEQALQEKQQQLAQYSASDPQRYEALRQAQVVAHDAVNRWTDNIELLRGWCKKRFEGMEQQLQELFEQHGAGDLEYLD